MLGLQRQPRRARSLAVLIGMAVVLFGAGVAQAGAGDLDPTFDGDGRVTSDVTSADRIRAIVVQPDGKIVAAGYSTSGGAVDSWSIARYLTDGSLDPAFGGGDGRVTLDWGTGSEAAYDVAIDGDGNIVAVGWAHNPVTAHIDVAVARFLPNGDLDPAFGGGDGKVMTTVSKAFDYAQGVAIAGDGTIVIAGVAKDRGSQNFALVRYLPSGALDTSFGGGDGMLTTDFAGGNDVANDVELSPGGKIVAAGYGFGPKGKSDFALARYRPTGKLDKTFSTDGKELTHVPHLQGSEINDSQVLGDGSILVAGDITVGSVVYAAVARYTVAGAVDPAFGGGIVTTLAGGTNASAEGISIQDDGKVVLGGWGEFAHQNDFLAVRFTAAGLLDGTFGAGGVEHTDFFGLRDVANGVAIQDDGNIVLGGEAATGPDPAQDFALARYLAA